MKTIAYIAFVLAPFAMSAQNTEGSIEYQELVKFEIDLPEEMKQYAAEFPTEQKTNMVLDFTSEESLYRLSERTEKLKEQAPSEDGVQIEVQTVIIGGGGSASTYYDLEDRSGLQAVDMMGSKFLISLDPQALDWSIANEQRDILGYTCMKATATENANTITAWFTSEIPLAIGPDGYGGLPGAILGVEIKGPEDDFSIAATSVDLGPLKKPIKKPRKGQSVSEQEFDEIVEKRMEMMREMNGGGEGGVIIKHEVDMD